MSLSDAVATIKSRTYLTLVLEYCLLVVNMVLQKPLFNDTVHRLDNKLIFIIIKAMLLYGPSSFCDL